jgi:hypothetical protein
MFNVLGCWPEALMSLRMALKMVIVANVALVLELLLYRSVSVHVAPSANSPAIIEAVLVFTLATSILTAVAALYEATRQQVAVFAGGYAALAIALLVRLTT